MHKFHKIQELKVHGWIIILYNIMTP